MSARDIPIVMPETVDEFVTVCDLQRWAVEREKRPTLAEALEDGNPFLWEDAS